MSIFDAYFLPLIRRSSPLLFPAYFGLGAENTHFMAMNWFKRHAFRTLSSRRHLELFSFLLCVLWQIMSLFLPHVLYVCASTKSFSVFRSTHAKWNRDYFRLSREKGVSNWLKLIFTCAKGVRYVIFIPSSIQVVFSISIWFGRRINVKEDPRLANILIDIPNILIYIPNISNVVKTWFL